MLVALPERVEISPGPNPLQSLILVPKKTPPQEGAFRDCPLRCRGRKGVESRAGKISARRPDSGAFGAGGSRIGEPVGSIYYPEGTKPDVSGRLDGFERIAGNTTKRGKRGDFRGWLEHPIEL